MKPNFSLSLLTRYVQWALACWTQVTVPASLGGSGNTYTDDTTLKYLDHGGHRTNWGPLLTDMVNLTQFSKDQATGAIGSANSNGTSSTSLTIGTGSKTFTTQSGKAWVVGQFVVAADAAAPSTNWMVGQITAYSGTTLTIDVNQIGGSGTIANWSIGLTGSTKIPAQAGNAGKYLKTDGTTTSWADPLLSNSTTTSSATTVTLTSASTRLHNITMTALGQHVALPDATTLSLDGTVFILRNAGTYPWGIRNNAGTLLIGVAGGGVAYVTLEANGVAAGTWSVVGNNLEPGLVTLDNTFSSTYLVTLLKPWVALTADLSIHFLTLSSGFAAVAIDNVTKAVGTPVTVDATANMVPRAAFKITATTAIVFYNVSGTHRAVVLSVSGATTIAVGTFATSATALWGNEDWSGAPKIVQLDTTLYLSSYAPASGATPTSVVGVQVSGGTTVNIGTSVNIIATTSISNSTTTYALTATTGLVFYLTDPGNDQISPFTINAVVISVTNANPPVCTVNTPAAGDTTGLSSDPPPSCLLSATKALFMGNTDTTTIANIQAVTISAGTTVSIGAILAVETGMTSGAQQYTTNNATRYNPHLFPLSASTAGLWYVDNNSVSRVVPLSESAGTVTKGNILYRSVSITSSGLTGYGLVHAQGTADFIVIAEYGAAAAFNKVVIPHKISGTAVSYGNSAPLPELSPVSNPDGLVSVRLTSGDYLAIGVNAVAIPVLRSNGDAINKRGSIAIPNMVGLNQFPLQNVASNRAVVIASTRGTTVSTITEQVRLLNVEVAA